MAEAQEKIVVTVPSTAMTAMQGTGDGKTIVTAPGQPNIELKVIRPLTMIGVRAFRTFLQTMLGVITAGPATGLIPAKDFNHLLITAASLSVGAAVISLIQNAVELLGKFDQTHPTLTS